MRRSKSTIGFLLKQRIYIGILIVETATAAKTLQPVANGLPGPGLLAQKVLANYGDHWPLNRQEDQVARYCLQILRSTLCDSVKLSGLG